MQKARIAGLVACSFGALLRRLGPGQLDDAAIEPFGQRRAVGRARHVKGVSDGPPEDVRVMEIAEVIAASELAWGRTSVVVVVVAKDSQARSDLGKGIRLRGFRGGAIHRDWVHVPEEPDACWTIVAYSVEPGPFALRYETFERRIVEQTVYAVSNRTTVVLLQHAHTSLVQVVKEGSRIRTRRGVDPARTTIVSLPAMANADRLASSLGTAEIILHKLRTRIPPPPPTRSS
jgi:hypothetical protein